MDQMLARRFLHASPIRFLSSLFLGLILPAALFAAPESDLFPFRDGSDCMYYNRQGDEKIRLKCSAGFVASNLSDSSLPDFIREAMGEFAEGLAPVRLADGKWRYIDASGKTILPASGEGYEDADRFSEGLARVRLNGRYGYIDRSGRMVIPARYARSGRFVQGMTFTQCDTGVYNYGYIDRTGKQALPCKYQDAFNFTADGLARARMWDLYGYIDRRGTAVLNFAYKFGGNFDGGLSYILKDEGFAFIDSKGKRHINIPQFDLVGDFSGELAPVRRTQNLRWGYIDRSGRLVVPAVFFEAFTHFRGLALVQGPESYTSADSIKENPAAVAPGKLAWYYIDAKGRRLFPR
jgi:hypothetical protein